MLKRKQPKQPQSLPSPPIPAEDLLALIDPVHQVTGEEVAPEGQEAIDAPVEPGWYYWHDDWMRREGPFESEEVARAKYEATQAEGASDGHGH